MTTDHHDGDGTPTPPLHPKDSPDDMTPGTAPVDDPSGAVPEKNDPGQDDPHRDDPEQAPPAEPASP